MPLELAPDATLANMRRLSACIWPGFLGSNVRFHDNSYRLPSSDARCSCGRERLGTQTTWRERFDQDASSTFTTAWPHTMCEVTGERSVTMREYGRVGIG